MKHVYLAPSRRLGISLGVSPIPFKTCSYSCVYCQLGRTTCKTVKRREFFSTKEILKEVEVALKRLSARPDHITFVGEGEPTLASNIGQLIEKIKEMTDISIAVITNGSLLFNEDVSSELMDADIVIPSLDAASEEVFRRINRPHPSLKIDRVIEGIEDFSRQFDGQLYVEVMLVKGYNDGSEVEKIGEVLKRIKPDGVYLMSPIRPPCEKVEPSERIEEVSKLLKAFNVITPESGEFHPEIYSSAEEALKSVLARHPLREEQVLEILNYFKAEKTILDSITERVSFAGSTYYRLRST
ncbi:MAG: radical SAM protein [Archaeoglobales archaeon]|nr:MAG: radical SAM protein [Archaeoglobales archaeon]